MKTQKKKNEELYCCICGKKIDERYSRNPDPLMMGENDRCCAFCDEKYVIPARVIENALSKLCLEMVNDETLIAPESSKLEVCYL